MKKIVLTFGLIAGAVLSAMLLATLPFQEQIGWDIGAVVGYTTMVVAFLLIFFGVRSYRDNVAGGSVRFGRAFAVGALIGAVASLCYTATWEVIYFKVGTIGSDFSARYQAHTLEKVRAEGASAEAIAARKVELERYARLYQNPAINAGITFFEPLPVAFIVALVSAGVLSRRKGRMAEGVMAGARASV